MFAIITVVAGLWVLFSFSFLVFAAMASANLTHICEGDTNAPLKKAGREPTVPIKKEFA